MLTKTFYQGFLALVIFSCAKPAEPGEPDYFPLQADTFATFRSEKTKYAGPDAVETTITLIRRQTDGPVTAPDGRAVYTFQYSHQNQSGGWDADSSNAAWRTTDKIFEQRNGQPVIKLMFPLSENLQWDSQAYTIFGKSISEAREVGKPCHTGADFFPRTVTIVRQDDSTLLSKKKYIEIYAENVGLVKAERIYLQYCIDRDCLGKGVVESGFKEILVLEKTGKR